jgi:hypothetical protein
VSLTHIILLCIGVPGVGSTWFPNDCIGSVPRLKRWHMRALHDIRGTVYVVLDLLHSVRAETVAMDRSRTVLLHSRAQFFHYIQTNYLLRATLLNHWLTSQVISSIKKALVLYLCYGSVNMVLVGKPEGKRPLGRPRRRWDDNINILKPTGYVLHQQV